MSKLSETIEEASIQLIKAVEQFAKNEDYRKFTVIDKIWTKDENGNKTYKEEVRVIETSVIRINEVKKAADIITRLAKAVRETSETVNSGKSDEQKSKDIQTAMSIQNQLSKYTDATQSQHPKELSLYKKAQLARK